MEHAPQQQQFCGAMARAPEQQQLSDTPGTQCKWEWTGIDLEKWEKEARPPTMYDPPQLKAPYMTPGMGCLGQLFLSINFWQQRSPLCVSPRVPCCCVFGLRKCIAPAAEVVRFDEPDEWMMKMLSTGTSPNCPEDMKGIFWLCDNIAPHEHLVTFHDGDWKTDKLMQKRYAYNWTTGSTLFGTGGMLGAKLLHVMLKIQISPNNKWLHMGGDELGAWIYRPDPDEKFLLPEGGELQLDPGEMMRISMADEGPDEAPVMENSKVAYQYRVRRVAYLNENGELVKTPAYEELLKLSKMPLKYHPCCCGNFYCLSNEERALKHFPMMPSETMVLYASPPPGAA